MNVYSIQGRRGIDVLDRPIGGARTTLYLREQGCVRAVYLIPSSEINLLRSQ